jgi:hypothetical protein
MGWKHDWVFLNIQIPKAMDSAMMDITRRSGHSKAAQVRQALMTALGIDDLSQPYTPDSKSATSNCNIAG